MAEEKNGRGCKQEYAEQLCDFMFKRMFGSEANKDVLIGFLNMILEDVYIVDVDFIPTEHLGLTEQDRKAVFDISCTCNDGRTLIIEMQKGFQEHFRVRAVYYTSFPINEQGRKAKEEFVKVQSCDDANAEFKCLFLLAKIGNFTPDELKEYEKSLNNMSDYYNIIDSAVARADKAALERGTRGGTRGGETCKRTKVETDGCGGGNYCRGYWTVD